MNRRVFLLLMAATGISAGAQAAPVAVEVYKNPWCGCCGAWAAALRQAGYKVTLHDSEDLIPLKKSLGIPENLQGCHTALIDGYYLEGHVPLDTISRLLSERQAIAGLAVPGMPEGSLGMGISSAASYDVFAVGPDGNATIYEHVGK